MVNINVKSEASGAEVKHMSYTNYYFKAASLEIRGNRINLPKRAATTVEFNANSNLKELVDMTTDISIIDKQLKQDSVFKLLHGVDEFEKIHRAIDSQISKMRYSKMKGFLIRPQKNAKNILKTKSDYEKIYDYSRQIAIGVKSDFYGLMFPHNIPVEEVKELWDKYVVNRNSEDPYPTIFLDPSEEDYMAFQYLISYLKDHVNSGHFSLLGTYYSSPVKMVPFSGEIINNFKNSDVAIFTVGIQRETQFELLSGLHGQELFMSDIVSVNPGRNINKKEDNTYIKPKYIPKAFLERNLTINKLSSLMGEQDNMNEFLTSIARLKSKELRDFINGIIQSYKIDEILNNSSIASDLGYAFKLHEMEKSLKEIENSRAFAKSGEISEYVKNVKPILNTWLTDVNWAYAKS